MYYLIHTSHHLRPYLSTVSFVAQDFAEWGYRVICYAKKSPYITEIQYQEKRNRPTCRRIELMEVWAKEVLARKQQCTSPAMSEASLPEARKERASAFAQDFVSSLTVFESPIKAPKALQGDPLPLPAYPLALVSKYARLIHRCAYITYATLPTWADPEIFIADQVTLEFRADKSVKREQLAYSLNKAVCTRAGRMGKIEKCRHTGMTKVLMWVDVGDLVMRECGKVEMEDPVPVYEIGEWEWPPSYQDCEGQC